MGFMKKQTLKRKKAPKNIFFGAFFVFLPYLLSIIMKLLNTIRFFILVTVIVYSFQSCISTSSFETGRSLGKGIHQTNIALGYATPKLPVDKIILNRQNSPLLNISTTWGVSKRLDLGLGFASNPDYYIKAKYMITNPESIISASIGSSFFVSPNSPEYLKNRLNTSLYTSYHGLDNIIIFINPELVFYNYSQQYNYGGAISFGILFNGLLFCNSDNFDVGLEIFNFNAANYQQQTYSIGIRLRN
ncbi:MAG: hypothetical protein B6I18_08485 [Bacteroidetes bacterium 4572_112]|nr:MAG: hypothetical protein B6I18_08485 [Bacteroidetes bacterium 4572_112]